MASFTLPLFFSSPLISSSSSSSPSSPSSPSLFQRRGRSRLPRSPSPIQHQLRIPSPALTFALAKSGSPKPADQEDDVVSTLEELAECLDLPSDYLEKLPRDLRLDLNDAAFDLSNGPVLEECGQGLGQVLLNLSKSWEEADTRSSRSISSQFPALANSLTDNEKSAFGKRLASAGRRFTSMGQYGQGELGRIANAMTKAGKLLSATPVVQTDAMPKTEKRTLKFGNLQVELTPGKAFAGAGIAFIFGMLSAALAQGIQSIPENSMEYANDNALQLAKSLRGALLTIGYSSTILSVVSAIGLLLLGQQLSSNGESEQ